MTQTYHSPPYTLGSEDKVAHVLVYTASALLMGELVVKKLIRVSTWLRTNNAPDWITLYHAKVTPTTAAGGMRATSFTELLIATREIQIFHLVPPARDPIDYDPSEPNRRMQPVSILAANFRIDGHLRLAVQTTTARFVEAARDPFTPVYEAKITCPQLPAMGTLQVPFLLVRHEASVYATG